MCPGCCPCTPNSSEAQRAPHGAHASQMMDKIKGREVILLSFDDRPASFQSYPEIFGHLTLFCVLSQQSVTYKK